VSKDQHLQWIAQTRRTHSSSRRDHPYKLGFAEAHVTPSAMTSCATGVVGVGTAHVSPAPQALHRVLRLPGPSCHANLLFSVVLAFIYYTQENFELSMHVGSMGDTDFTFNVPELPGSGHVYDLCYFMSAPEILRRVPRASRRVPAASRRVPYGTLNPGGAHV
jgi:hypothetical protein